MSKIVKIYSKHQKYLKYLLIRRMIKKKKIPVAGDRTHDVNSVNLLGAMRLAVTTPTPVLLVRPSENYDILIQV